MESQRYEIRIRGTLGPDWTDWFEGMELRQEEAGQTVIIGLLPDQSALHGLLARIRNLNLSIISIASVPPTNGGTDQKESER